MKRLGFLASGTILSALFAVLSGCATPDAGPQRDVEDAAPFGGEGSAAYAEKLWRSMAERNLVGANAITAKPYQGTFPHGAILVAYEGEVSVGDHAGIAIVQNNYDGGGLTESTVANHPDQNLVAITVMFKREAGYDPDNANWFWAQYKPGGGLETNPQGMLLAGRIAKGKPEGCIACHKLAPGADFVYNHNRFAN